MDNYDEWSDEQVNEAVALTFTTHGVVVDTMFGRRMKVHDFVDRYAITDYCGNDADIMPIAWEHGISVCRVFSDDPLWTARHRNTGSGHEVNPRRAIAICYLMMMEGV